MIRDDLFTYLTNQQRVTQYLGSSPTYLCLAKIPQAWGTRYPRAAFRRATGGHEHDLDGSAGYAAPVFEFAVMDTDFVRLEKTCEAIRLSLQGYTGMMGATRIQRVTLDDEIDQYIDAQDGSDLGILITTLKYTIGYTEAIPAFS